MCKKKTLFISVIILSICCLLSINSIAFADPTTDEANNTNSEANAAIENEINEKQIELDKLSADYGDALLEQEKAQNEINTLQDEINQLNTKIESNKKQIKSILQMQYKTGAVGFIDLILSSENVIDFVKNVELTDKIAQQSTDAINEYQKSISEKTEKENAAQENKAIVDEKVKAAEDAKNKAQEILNNLKQIKVSEYTPAPLDPNCTNPVVIRAYQEQGKPYVWGAVGPAGYDCSGLVSYCLTGQHKRIGTTHNFINWPETSTPEAGDILVNDEHCGIYIGGNKMIHAPQTGDVVRISDINWFLARGAKFVKYPG